MPFLSGTLRFWSGDEKPTEVQMECVEFSFDGTWEPSLIVEERYVAVVAGRRVSYGEFEGVANGLSIKVENAEHAELLEWVRHAPGSGAATPGPNFVDSVVLEMSPGWGGS